MKKLSYYISLLIIGAIGYNIIEVIWRGYTHWSMTIDGGLCLLFIGLINEKVNKSKLIKSIICAMVITIIELVSGIVLNLWLKLNVWDYSDCFLNFYGQICPLYTILWIGLSYIILSVMEKSNIKNQKTA